MCGLNAMNDCKNLPTIYVFSVDVFTSFDAILQVMRQCTRGQTENIHVID